MRKVAMQAACAFANGKTFRSKNTEVSKNAVYLHGHKIMWREGERIHLTLAGWPTVTTRGRLNDMCRALGFDVRFWQRNHSQFITVKGVTHETDSDEVWYI